MPFLDACLYEPMMFRLSILCFCCIRSIRTPTNYAVINDKTSYKKQFLSLLLLNKRVADFLVRVGWEKNDRANLQNRETALSHK